MPASSQGKTDGRSKKRPGVDEQRDIILRAAVELFSANGTHSVSIAQICAHADVSRPTFYRCYADKAELVAAIYQNAVNEPVESMLLRARLSDPAQLKLGVDQMLDGIFAQAPLAKLVFMEANDPTSAASQIVDEAFARAADSLTHDLQQIGTDIPSRTYLKSVMAAIQWIAYDAIRKGLSKKDIETAKEAAFELILRALA